MRERLLKFALTLHPERTLCGGTPPAARARQAGDLQLPGLHLHLRQDSPGQIPDQKEDPARPHAGEAQDDQTGDVAAHASANSQTGTMAVVRRPRLLQLSRSADQCAGTERVPAPCYRPLAAHAAASQPKGSGHMDTDDAAGERLASESDHPPPLAERSLRRHTPKVGAVCGKAARTVLCGGRAMKRASLPLRRREFMALVGGALASPIAARAQQPSVPVIGFLSPLEAYPPSLNEFHNGLAESGYHEGRNVLIEYRWGEGHYDRLPTLAADLVRRRVNVIVAGGGSISGLAAKAATSTIPIVALSGGDPVTLGLVASLSRPSSNVTGVAQLVTAAKLKRLELLHELVPTSNAIAYLVNPGIPTWPIQDMESEARRLGVKLAVLTASSDRDLAAAFATINQEGVG